MAAGRLRTPNDLLPATFLDISQISGYEMEPLGSYWRFSLQSAQRLFEEVFIGTNAQVKAYGNVLPAMAFLHGLAAQELSQQEPDRRDPDYDVLIADRAVKPETGS